MDSEISSHVIIHIHSYQGQLIIGDKWMSITADLHRSLKQHGIEDKRSSPTLMQFKFNHPFSALATVLETLIKIKNDHHWPDEQEPLPVQIIFHMDKAGELTPPIREASSDIWDFLENEKIYVTNTLKHQWNAVMSGRRIPSHSFESVGQGLYLLDFKESLSIKTKKLFQHRNLILSGKYPECFYCGMTSHEPIACPSKYLSLNLQGLELIGFLPFDEINSLAPEVFQNPENLYKVLAAGISSAELRKSHPLILLTGFLDTNIHYQPRFLWQLTFSSASGWQGALETDSESLKVDSPAMQLGLDCLRVGKLDEAAEQFEKELNHPKGQNKFYASVGMAFVNLEKNEKKYMEHFLNKSSELANTDKEIVYIKLLQARFLNLKERFWEAEQALKSALSTDRNCHEARYALVRVAARSGFGEKSIPELQRLAKSEKGLFISTLIDPELEPLRGLVEDMLFATFHTRAQRAANNLNNARNECEDLSEWLIDDDKQLANNRKTLVRLEKLLEKGSYYGILEVKSRAEGLIYNCKRIRDEMCTGLKDKLNHAYSILSSCEKFWNNYSHQAFFNNFAVNLASVKRKILHAGNLLEKYTGKSFAESQRIILGSREELSDLQKSISKMISLKNIFDTTRLFSKYLMISEVIAIIAVTLGLMIFGIQSGTGAMGKSGLLKQALIITAFFIAPFLALVFTAKKSNMK